MHGFAGTNENDILSVIRDAVHRHAHQQQSNVNEALEALLDLVVHENDFLHLFPIEWHRVLSQSTGRRTLRTTLEMLLQLVELQSGHLRDVGRAPDILHHGPLARAAPS